MESKKAGVTTGPQPKVKSFFLLLILPFCGFDTVVGVLLGDLCLFLGHTEISESTSEAVAVSQSCAARRSMS